MLLATATDTVLGSGKWGLGPSLVFMSQPKWGPAGVLVQNVWSLPGAAKRYPICQLLLVVAVSRNLAHECT